MNVENNEITPSEFTELVKGSSTIKIIIDDKYPQYGLKIELSNGCIVHLQAKTEYDIPSIEFTRLK